MVCPDASSSRSQISATPKEFVLGGIIATDTADEINVEKVDEAKVLEGEIVYRCNPQRQFNDFSDKAHEIFETFGLYASTAKAEALGSKVEIDFGSRSITVDVIADERMEGDITALSDFKSAQDVYSLFGESRYKTVTMRKV